MCRERLSDDVSVALDPIAPRSMPVPLQHDAQSVIAGKDLPVGLHPARCSATSSVAAFA